MADDRLVSQPRVAAAQRRGHVRVPHGEALDVRLIDDHVLVAVGRPVVVRPVELLADDQAARHLGRGVHGRGRVAVRGREAQDLRPGRDRPSHRLRVRVEEQFRRVAAQSAGRIVGAGDPVAVPLAHLDTWHEAMPDSRIKITQRNPVLGARLVEQAEVNPVGDRRRPRRSWFRPRRTVVPSGNGVPGSGAVGSAGWPAALPSRAGPVTAAPASRTAAGCPRRSGHHRGGGGSRPRSAPSSRSGARRRSRPRCRRGNTR